MAQVSGTFPQLTEPHMTRRVSLSPAKARTILHDGAVRGHPLTPKQQRFFGAMATAKKKPTVRGQAPPTRVPGGLATHRAMSRALTRRRSA